jgi:proliferating cell nuclear antigen PCNA
MEIQLTDHLGSFRRSIDAIREFLPQAQFRFTEDGIRISGMDASHVGFVDCFLSAEDCEVFRIPSASNIGISTLILSKVLSSAGAADTLTISEVGDYLKLSFKTEGRSANFELSTLEIQEDTVDLPDMNYGAIVKAKAADISSMIKDLAIFGDQATLSLDEDGFHVKSAGDSGKGELILEPSEDRDMTVEGDSVEISFGMKYLQQIVRSCSPLSMYMELSFDNGQPLRVRVNYGKQSHFIAYLAPKISED